jgi:hypothetical protein
MKANSPVRARAIALALSALILSTSAHAASVTLGFSGTTTSTITDGTNYFGLGTSVAAGQNYTLSVTYDNSFGNVGNFPVPRSSGESRSSFSEVPPSFPGLGFPLSTEPVEKTPGPSHITSIGLTINGVLLNIAGAQFTDHFSITTTQRISDTRGPFGCVPPGQTVSFGCTFFDEQSYLGVDMNGTAANGSTIDARFLQGTTTRGTSGPFFPSVLPQITTTGSLSLLLLNDSKQAIASILALNAFGAAAVDTGGNGGGTGGGGGTSDVPVPTALPLFAAGLAALGGLSRRRKSKAA